MRLLCLANEPQQCWTNVALMCRVFGAEVDYYIIKCLAGGILYILACELSQNREVVGISCALWLRCSLCK
jgi:hypothetical protein